MAENRARSEADDALQRVEAALGPKIRQSKLNHGQVDCTTDPQNVVDVMRTLRDDPNIGCKFFTFLSAVDRSEFGEDKTGMEVLVHLFSPEHRIHVNVHVPVDPERPVCPSISSLFAGALWQERETHEMFGIDFEGHPHLVNLYLPEDFEGHPLRKDFKLPSRMVKDWPGAKDPEEAAAGGRG